MLNLSILNENQLNAVKETEGPVLVLAGAGSGKTRVLTYRIAYLIEEKGVMPYNILAITFTNKATYEMKERLNSMLGDDNRVFISTFHSFCVTVLRNHADKLGYGKNFTIYDESDSAKTLGRILKEFRLEDGPLKDKIRGYISDAKNKGMTPDEYRIIAQHEDEGEDIIKIFMRYEEVLKLNNAFDFDDLLHKVKFLFQYNKETCLSYYQNRFRYIHVDEFQDTNKVQFDIVKMLAEKHRNLFVVGDDDQSIYAWRGAEVENILSFDKIYSEAKIFKLEQNYRSTMSILNAANNVIKNNCKRHDKNLFSDKGAGVRVEYYVGYNDHDEVDYVVNSIMSLKKYNGYRNKDIAILVRVNSLTRMYESKLSYFRLGYKVLGGFKFFDRKEIQDVIAYMRIIANPNDNEAFLRIANFPRRGIGDTTLDSLVSVSQNKMISLMDIMINNMTGALNSSAVKKLDTFKEILLDLKDKRDLPVDLFCNYLVDRVGFKDCYLSTGKEEDENRYENIVEFLGFVKDYVKNNEGATVDTFLENVTLNRESNDEIIDNDMITLATMHAVKGLEYKVVYIVGCEEETMPSSRAMNEDGGLEEERRIMYVAVTRAMERLYITAAKRRFKYNKVINCLPSRFIAESKGETENKGSIYELFGDKKDNFNSRSQQYYSFDGDDAIFASSNKSNYKAEPILPITPAKNNVKDLSQYVAGVKVKHETFGEGTIILVSGFGNQKIGTVVFPSTGIKKFSLALAKLTIIE